MMPRVDDLVITAWGARYKGHHFPCAIGRGGIGQKCGEGDGITPVGRFQILECGYRADRMFFANKAVGSKAIGLQDIWSDDPKDPRYNCGLNGFDHPYSHERLYRSDPLYDLFAALSFNKPEVVAGKGSAIFLHAWRGPRYPTQGCVAFDPRDLYAVLSSWDPRARVIICG